MPIATPQGTLDFKSVDKVTFVGASSNTVIDTTTGSLGVGVGVGGPTSNLHVVGHTHLEGDINMLHTANTASIKLNSNVVTEFPRSKKLIKYPRVALTYDAQSSQGGYENYIVNQSSVYTSENSHGAYKSFRGNEHWLSSANSFDGGDDVFNNTNGPWISIQLPTKIKLEYLEFYAASGRLGQLITAGSVFASNNGSTWINIGSLDSLGTYTNIVPARVDFTHTTLYDRYLLHITANATNYVHMEKLSLFGVPEYDPEAAGLDVKVTSYPNVPNTDWLEVYYDAKNYSGSGDVQDESGNNRNGTLNGGVGFDTTYKAFTFDGVNDYIRRDGIPTPTGASNFTLTVSMWFKVPSLATTGILWGMAGEPDGTDGSPPADSSIPHAFVNTSGQISWAMWANDAYTSTGIIQTNRWHHCVWTYSGGTTGRRVFLDGVEQMLSGGIAALNMINTTSRLTIGIYPHNLSSNPLNGSIANFRLFNRALTSDEVWQLYAYQKEYFGHGDLSITLKAGRLGIGTSEPRAALDVRGASIRGPLTTFLSHDDTLQIYTNMPTAATEYLIKSAEFEIPEVYRSLGNVNLQANSTVKWMGEISNPWNTVFRLYIEYPKGPGGVTTIDTGAYLGWNKRFGHGFAASSYSPQFQNTHETAIIATGHTLEDCRCNSGDKLTVKLYAACEDEASEIYTNRTQYSDNSAYNERGNTNFFIALKVV